MNDLELRLREDLHRGDTQMDVSETQLGQARHRFRHRREQLERLRRLRVAAGAVAAVAAAVSVGVLGTRVLPEQETPPPAEQEHEHEHDDTTDGSRPLTLENLAGLYAVPESDGWMWQFAADGHFEAQSPGGEPGHVESGAPVTVDGTTIALPAGMCDVDAALTSEGQLTVVASRVQECPFVVGDAVTLTRVSPVSETGAGLTWAHDAERERRPVTWLGSLRGVWLDQGTGRTLMIELESSTGAGTYRLDDDGDLFTAPDDRGRLRLEESGELVMTSSGASAGCEPGSSVVLDVPVLRVGDTGFGGLSRAADLTTTSEPMCTLHEDLTGLWIKVS